MPLKNAHTLKSFVKAENGTSPSKSDPKHTTHGVVGRILRPRVFRSEQFLV